MHMSTNTSNRVGSVFEALVESKRCKFSPLTGKTLVPFHILNSELFRPQFEHFDSWERGAKKLGIQYCSEIKNLVKNIEI